jgi:hypothetical protein
MNDLKKNKNYVVAKGPVNRRTSAVTHAPAAPPVAASVRSRVSVAHAKRRLGTPLSQRLLASGPEAANGQRPTGVAIVQAIGATMGTTGLGLGVIQGSVIVMATGAVTLAGIAVWVGLRRRFTTPAAHPTRLAPDIADTQALERLDALMEKIASDGPPLTVEQLAKLKESVVRCFALIAADPEAAGGSTEETLYIREAVRRYIPDSIQACLQVPVKDRTSLVIDASKTALDLFHDQLALIQQQLDTRETRLVQAAGEALMRQQRFLAAKSAERT